MAASGPPVPPGGGSDPDWPLADDRRAADIVASLKHNRVPSATYDRLDGTRKGWLPWTATLTPSELLLARSHGLRPVAAVSATCWLHYGWSWTEGHAEGWNTALRRLRAEARVAGANAVLDVKLRTVRLPVADSMDFSLVGTAVRVDGLPPSPEPIVATVPALEFVRLLDADVVPTGIAVGARYDWLTGFIDTAGLAFAGNVEVVSLGRFWDNIRRDARAELRRSAAPQGDGVLAHVDFSQMFKVERDKTVRYLGRHITVATTVDARRGAGFPPEVRTVVDMRAGPTPLAGHAIHHQSYATTDEPGAI